MKHLAIVLAALAACVSLEAEIRLSPLFTDNMVFQQCVKAPVWGKAFPGATVTVTPSWNGKTYSCVTGPDGKWSLRIDTPKGSYKKYTVTISDGEPLTLHNVVVGEVWVCSGQSNMEMPVESWRAVRINKDDIDRASEYPFLRLLYVTKTTGMSPRDNFDAENDGWTESSPKTARTFSAVAYYFGRALQKDLKVPVGVIETCWGGTVIEAWMSEEILKGYPEMAPGLERVRTLAPTETDRELTFKKEMARFVEQARKADKGLSGDKPLWADPAFDDSSWKTMILPEKVQKLWPGINGVYWFRKEVEIPSGWAGKDLILSLGPVDDYDDTYIDGVYVGGDSQWNKAREYTVPGNRVKGGRQVICVRVTDDHGDGGLYGAADQMFLEAPDGQRVPLDGEWKVELSLSFEDRPVSPAREPNLTTVLYNAMINPLVPFAMKGAIWYQGESNAGKAYRYRDLMRDMILDWRRAWGSEFPFYITQLAGYHPVSPVPGESSWAELREAQDLASRTLEKTGLACSIDLGEAEDVHPVRKREVGERLALLALARDYGREVVATGPRYESYSIGDGYIRVKFSSVGSGLKVIPSDGFADARYGSGAMDSEPVRKAERGELTGFRSQGLTKSGVGRTPGLRGMKWWCPARRSFILWLSVTDGPITLCVTCLIQRDFLPIHSALMIGPGSLKECCSHEKDYPTSRHW